ncbi:HAD family hydrolase [Collinsella ihumii]|uniref:HAD family hydrolase n=1 Tax=Collinsella ihumii TaxID=1720204 RepID=UPI000832B6B5|nr:HAD hydrolase-like protein [Collinsella ihumii]
MRYRFIVFDFDGTLADTSVGINNAFDAAARRMGLPVLPSERREGLIGPPIKESFARLYGLGEDAAREGAELFREEYAQPERLAETVLYPGTSDMLDKLVSNGVNLAIATNKRTDCTKDILRMFGLDELFSAVCGSEPGTFESKPQIVARCLQQIGAELSTTLLVGDTETDCNAAMANSIDFLAVGYGFGYQKYEMPSYSVGLANCSGELLERIERINRCAICE